MPCSDSSENQKWRNAIKSVSSVFRLLIVPKPVRVWFIFKSEKSNRYRTAGQGKKTTRFSLDFFLYFTLHTCFWAYSELEILSEPRVLIPPIVTSPYYGCVGKLRPAFFTGVQFFSTPQMACKSDSRFLFSIVFVAFHPKGRLFVSTMAKIKAASEWQIHWKQVMNKHFYRWVKKCKFNAMFF